ncbi:MAG: hypothetical protein GY798_17935 [Hyphomicrobiales bacterium]|nr:hypothetical protein [Hyphomicrobiales bacterium]
MRTSLTMAGALSAAAFISTTGLSAAEEVDLCEPFDVYSSGEFREARSIDNDGDGSLSAGDKRVGHRVLQDADGNKIGDRYYATTTEEVDADGKETVRFTETVNVIGDGVIFATKERIGGKDQPSTITEGTGGFAGVKGTITVDRDGPANVYHFNLTCDPE